LKLTKTPRKKDGRTLQNRAFSALKSCISPQIELPLSHQNKGVIMEDKEKTDAFIQALLEERDKLFQQNARLRSQLDGHAEVDTMKASYEKTINNKDIEIRSLKEQVERLLRQVCGEVQRAFYK